MNVFNQVKRGAKRAGFEAERVVRVERIQTQISALNGQLRNSLGQLGRLTYELNQRGEITHAELRHFCAQLDALREQIAAHESEIEAIRAEVYVEAPSSVVCARCGAACAPGMQYCPRCGVVLPRTAEPAPIVAGAACPRCATVNAAGARSCLRCGQSLVAPPASPGMDSPPAPPVVGGQFAPPALGGPPAFAGVGDAFAGPAMGEQSAFPGMGEQPAAPEPMLSQSVARRMLPDIGVTRANPLQGEPIRA